MAGPGERGWRKESEGEEETEGQGGQAGEQRAKGQSQTASGQELEDGGKLVTPSTELGGRDATHRRPEGQ